MRISRLLHFQWRHMQTTSKLSSNNPFYSLSLKNAYIHSNSSCRCENGDWAQRTDWHQVAVFRPDLRENVKNYLTKGQRVLLFGKITYGEVQDKDGNLRNTVSIVADDITFFNS